MNKLAKYIHTQYIETISINLLDTGRYYIHITLPRFFYFCFPKKISFSKISMELKYFIFKNVLKLNKKLI